MAYENPVGPIYHASYSFFRQTTCPIPLGFEGLWVDVDGNLLQRLADGSDTSVSEVSLADIDIYISTTGNDANDGSSTAPVLTYARAALLRDTIYRGLRCRLNWGSGTFTLPSVIQYSGGPDGPAATPEFWIGTAVDQYGSLASTTGTGAQHIVATTSPLASGTTTGITVSGSLNTQTRTMIVAGMTGLTDAKVGNHYLFACAPNAVGGNNGVFELLSQTGGTTGTFRNAQAVADPTNPIYWQETAIGADLRFTSGATPIASGPRKITAHGELATSLVTIAAVPADGNTLVVNDGVNPAVTFEWDSNGSVVETSTLKALVFTGSETFAQLAAILNTKIRATFSTTFRINSTYSTGDNDLLMETGLPGALTTTPTQTGAWATLVAFSGGGANGTVGTSLNTFSCRLAAFTGAAASLTFVVEREGTVWSYSSTRFEGQGSQLATLNGKFKGTSSTASLTFSGVRWSPRATTIAMAGGTCTIEPGAIAGHSTVPWSIDPTSPFGTATVFQLFAHSGAMTIQDTGLIRAPMVGNHMSLAIANFSESQGAFLSRRSTVSISGRAYWGTGRFIIEGALFSTDTAILTLDIQSGASIAGIAGTFGVISYSPGYGVLVKAASKFRCGGLTGRGNVNAGIRIDQASHVLADVTAANATALKGNTGHIEFGHATTPLIKSYTVLRNGGDGNKGFCDDHGNRIDF